MFHLWLYMGSHAATQDSWGSRERGDDTDTSAGRRRDCLRHVAAREICGSEVSVQEDNRGDRENGSTVPLFTAAGYERCAHLNQSTVALQVPQSFSISPTSNLAKRSETSKHSIFEVVPLVMRLTRFAHNDVERGSHLPPHGVGQCHRCELCPIMLVNLPKVATLKASPRQTTLWRSRLAGCYPGGFVYCEQLPGLACNLEWHERRLWSQYRRIYPMMILRSLVDMPMDDRW